MREECRIEIKTDAFFFSKIYPSLEMFRFDFIAVYFFIGDTVGSVQVEFMFARN